MCSGLCHGTESLIGLILKDYPMSPWALWAGWVPPNHLTSFWMSPCWVHGHPVLRATSCKMGELSGCSTVNQPGPHTPMILSSLILFLTLVHSSHRHLPKLQCILGTRLTEGNLSAGKPTLKNVASCWETNNHEIQLCWQAILWCRNTGCHGTPSEGKLRGWGGSQPCRVNWSWPDYLMKHPGLKAFLVWPGVFSINIFLWYISIQFSGDPSFFFKVLQIFVCAGSSCCVRALSSCRARVSHCGGFSCRGAQALELTGSAAVALQI